MVRSLFLLTPLALVACTENSGVEATLASQPAGEGAANGGASSLTVPIGVQDSPIADWQRELLRIAFDAPTQMPLNPHIKNRADGQEIAVNGALALEQFATAYEFADQIPTYQRGVGMADLAFELAERDEDFDYGPIFAVCEEVLAAPSAIAEVEQAWRKDQVRSKMARTLLLRGEDEAAIELVAGIEASQAVYFEEINAKRLSKEEAEQQLAATPELLKTADFARQKNLMDTLVTLYVGHFEDEDLRQRIRSTMEDNWQGYPVIGKVEALMTMADAAATAGDEETTLAIVADAKAMVSELVLSMDAEVPLRARIAARRASVGDKEKAIEELDAAMQIFEAGRAEVFDMFRGAALRPVAEAYIAAGDSQKAMAVYKVAMKEGVLNVNSRPRALDLAATCVSIATHGQEPDEELMNLIEAAYEGLGAPW